MNKTKKLILVLIILLLTNLNTFIIDKSVANLSYVNIVRYSGGLLPKENVSLSMTSANVIINADTSNLKYLGAISFSGNYTIFNPDQDINFTIGAPFEFFPPENCIVLVNGTSIPYDIINDYQIDYQEESQIWNQYLYNRTGVIYGFWVLCNISIPKNTSIKLQYDFITPKPTHDELEGYYDIIYDVGTARLWNGNITESVEIRVNGHLPDSIYNEQSCVISNILNGKKYCWDWRDERIEINYVGLNYYFNFEKEYITLYNSIRITLILVTSLVGVAFILIKKYYKKNKL